jgi:hypothetical protein
VVVKGTEFFDGNIMMNVSIGHRGWLYGILFKRHLGKLGRYVDFPVTDVLQMIGRAGRPQFDETGPIHSPASVSMCQSFLYRHLQE